MAVRHMLVAGRYRLVEPVGAGGMGRVWLARDEMLHRDVAVKEVVPPDWMSDVEQHRMHERTLREARSAARLNHPHVVRIYDVLHTGGLSWIVMEYVQSRSLYQVLNEDGPYDPMAAARTGLAVLDALTAAHRAGVLHRDVKPHNVLIGADGRVVLTDFGLATFVDDGGVTAPGLIVGSPQYVSPERARNGASTVESDLWSLGATLYAAVEGHSPYARETAMATLAALAAEPPDPPRRAGPLATVLDGLLRYEPAARLTHQEIERRLRMIVFSDPQEIPRVPTRHGARHGASRPGGASPIATSSGILPPDSSAPAPRTPATPGPISRRSGSRAAVPRRAGGTGSGGWGPPGATDPGEKAPAAGLPATPRPASGPGELFGSSGPHRGRATVPGQPSSPSRPVPHPRGPLPADRPASSTDSSEPARDLPPHRWHSTPHAMSENDRTEPHSPDRSQEDRSQEDRSQEDRRQDRPAREVRPHSVAPPVTVQAQDTNTGVAAAVDDARRSGAGTVAEPAVVPSGGLSFTKADTKAGLPMPGIGAEGTSDDAVRPAADPTDPPLAEASPSVPFVTEASSAGVTSGGGRQPGPGTALVLFTGGPATSFGGFHPGGEPISAGRVPDSRQPGQALVPIRAVAAAPIRPAASVRAINLTAPTHPNSSAGSNEQSSSTASGTAPARPDSTVSGRPGAAGPVPPNAAASTVDADDPGSRQSDAAGSAHRRSWRRAAPAAVRVTPARLALTGAVVLLLGGSLLAGYLIDLTSGRPQVYLPVPLSTDATSDSAGPTSAESGTSSPPPGRGGPISSATLSGMSGDPAAPSGPAGPSPVAMEPQVVSTVAPGETSSPATEVAPAFSPPICDTPPPDGLPGTPVGGASRGVNGWRLDAGWSYFTDGSGFHIAVPNGWSHQRIGTTHCFRGPRNARVLTLDAARDPAIDPLEQARAEEARLATSGALPGYSLIRIDRVPLLNKAADWEYRYRSASGSTRRCILRWFVMGGRTYVLGWSTTEKTWDADLIKIQMIRSTFFATRPKPSPSGGR